MMASSNGNIFRVSGLLWEEYTGHRSQRPAAMRSFDAFFDLCLNKRLRKQSGRGDLRHHHVHYYVTVMDKSKTHTSERSNVISLYIEEFYMEYPRHQVTVYGRAYGECHASIINLDTIWRQCDIASAIIHTPEMFMSSLNDDMTTTNHNKPNQNNINGVDSLWGALWMERLWPTITTPHATTDVMPWQRFPLNWSFVRGNHRSSWIPLTKGR